MGSSLILIYETTAEREVDLVSRVLAQSENIQKRPEISERCARKICVAACLP